jgi:hypothetical protein
MYLWIGLAVACFAGLAFWGMLRPSSSDADAAPRDTYIPEVKTAAQRAEEDRLAEMVKRLREQEASRIIVLDGSRNAATDNSAGGDQKPAAAAKPIPEMFIRFRPSTQPSTRPATIGGRTKPFLAPDVAEDGSYFGQIDRATGKPKTVYYSNLGKYVVEDAPAAAAAEQKPVRPVRTQGGISSTGSN